MYMRALATVSLNFPILFGVSFSEIMKTFILLTIELLTSQPY